MIKPAFLSRPLFFPALLPIVLVLSVFCGLGKQAHSQKLAETPRFLDASVCGAANAPAWCVGSDLGSWVNAADRALGPLPGTVAVGAPGTATTAIDLARGHSLQLDAPVSLKLPATLHGGQTVSCSGPLASIGALGSTAFSAATGAQGITIRDCTFTNASSTMLLVGTYTTDLAILHNTGGCILYQGNAGKLPGRNYLIEGNTSVNCPTPAAVYITQSWDNIRVLGNHFMHETSGAEWFGPDAAQYPSYAALSTGDRKNVVFANNTCEEMAATCAWGSGMWRTLMQGNSADGCGDICFDLEGSADSSIVGNSCRNAQNGCACPGFFSGFHNSVLSNDFASATGTALITIKNNQGDAAHMQDIIIRGNNLSCVDRPCAVVHSETSLGLVFAGNHVLNGRFDNVGVAVQGIIQDNDFEYTLQAADGAGNRVKAGLNTPTQYHSYITVKNNVINTRVAQAPGTFCMNAAELDPTGGNTFYLSGNECTGPWADGIFLGGVPATYYLHDNFVPVLPSAPGSKLYLSGNHTPSGSHD